MDMKIIPRRSEKSYHQVIDSIYTFDVPMSANKQQISSAISAQYDVKVVDVNIAVAKGKVKRTWRKGGSPVVGKRVDTKKAYVRLAEGQSIPVFDEATTEAKAPEEKK